MRKAIRHQLADPPKLTNDLPHQQAPLDCICGNLLRWPWARVRMLVVE
jgi:hypothetical protein